MNFAAIAGKPRLVVYLAAHAILFVGGLALMALQGGIPFAIGTGLVAAGVTGWVLFAYVLLTETTAAQLALLTTFGVTGAFMGRSVAIKAEYDRRLSAARSQIDIIGFGLRALRQDYASEFERWKRQAHVRILLIDPAYLTQAASLADARDLEEREAPGRIRDDVSRFLSETAPLRDNRFQVRLYRCLPAINYFLVDDEIFWGPYLIGDQSRNMPTLLTANGGKLFDRLQRHFEEIWSSTTFSAEPPSADGD
jgi:hypothetical protein